jgi:hypothetical protein
MATIDLRNTTLRIAERSGSYIDVKIGEGELTWSEKRQIDFVKSRGELDTVRENEEVPLELSLVFIWEHIMAGSGEPVTVEDALKKRNGASGWTSTSTDTKAPYCVNILLYNVPPCTGVQTETILFQQFHWIELAHSLKDATVALKGNCNTTQALVSRS